MLFVIEHLEPELSEWLFLEYSSAARIAGRKNLLITNVRSKRDRERLSKICRAVGWSARVLFNSSDVIVLDPQARKALTPSDRAQVIIVGGILGDDPPRGRTKKLLSIWLPRAMKRNLGKHQFSIDGSIYLAKQVLSGHPLEEIPCARGVEIKVEPGLSIVLPFSYPLVGGKPLISPPLVRFLKRRGIGF